MSTTRRHGDLIGQIYADVVNKYKEFLKKREINPRQEQSQLVHYGEKKEMPQLVDITKIKDKDYFVSGLINDLNYVQPDFMLFKDNPYWENQRQTRTAGLPDLIVEVWSEGNPQENRDFKFKLYSSSDITEHWYIEQDCNIIKCYQGGARLPDQNLHEVLRTQRGVEFDLRYLAL